MSKVIFMDIDGVLNTERQQNHCLAEGIAYVDGFGFALTLLQLLIWKKL